MFRRFVCKCGKPVKFYEVTDGVWEGCCDNCYCEWNVELLYDGTNGSLYGEDFEDTDDTLISSGRTLDEYYNDSEGDDVLISYVDDEYEPEDNNIIVINVPENADIEIITVDNEPELENDNVDGNRTIKEPDNNSGSKNVENNSVDNN